MKFADKKITALSDSCTVTFYIKQKSMCCVWAQWYLRRHGNFVPIWPPRCMFKERVCTLSRVMFEGGGDC